MIEVLRPSDPERQDPLPSDLLDLRVHAQFLIEEYEDRLTGKRQRRLRVPYSGYDRAAG